MSKEHVALPSNPPKLKKALGQNFLHNPSVCARICALLDLTASDQILEIGPGAGALTKHLENCPHSRLLLVEKDHYWARERQKAAKESTLCVLADALRFDYTRLKGQHFTIVGNLPYNIASPLIWTIAQSVTDLKQAVFMVQKEVAERLAARPGQKSYGALSVWVQSFLKPRLAFTVKPGNFTPPPKVDSAVVHFSPLSEPLAPSLHAPFNALLKLCFQKRRKQLAHILRSAQLPDFSAVLADLGLAATCRPEEIPVKSFQQLAAFLADVLTGPERMG
ncbi:MAG: 16S rRNA (adenine(1518)-N(6)/adenine(1519)-N(6))-dimethyltransferase RsmA [Desulfovibrio sp.]|nr:16S rRNA (adenine(1518)-N(6)/adenine(1519)-N(6))-dimethyltransferase RsmA [Desulfovibrio sp.]